MNTGQQILASGSVLVCDRADPRPSRSARDTRASAPRLESTLSWLAERTRSQPMTVTRTALSSIAGWSTDERTGTIGHGSGRFFSVEGVEVHLPGWPVPTWNQPIILQPEVGILGILAATFGGVLHLLLQAKIEPGNPRGHQLSPTVQATRSNYTGVHRGHAVPHLDYFLHAARHQVRADVRQSEQGSWFLQKRNRNMIVEVEEPIEVLDGFRWFTLAEIHHLLAVENVVNMDARSVLSCLPLDGAGLTQSGYAASGQDPHTEFAAALAASMNSARGSLHTAAHVLSSITACRTRREVSTLARPLAGLPGWRRSEDAIAHHTGAFFEVIAVDVRATGREVVQWSQPMFAAVGLGLAAFLVTAIDGVLHVLMHLRVEVGFVDVVELAPTVQCTPASYRHLPHQMRPQFLDHIQDADAGAVRYDTVLSEEGGRFHNTETRYVVVETDEQIDDPNYLWLTLHQLDDLLRHSHYVNVQARSLVACLRSLITPTPRRTP